MHGYQINIRRIPVDGGAARTARRGGRAWISPARAHASRRRRAFSPVPVPVPVPNRKRKNVASFPLAETGETTATASNVAALVPNPRFSPGKLHVIHANSTTLSGQERHPFNSQHLSFKAFCSQPVELPIFLLSHVISNKRVRLHLPRCQLVRIFYIFLLREGKIFPGRRTSQYTNRQGINYLTKIKGSTIHPTKITKINS